jgi:hypothetical protein
MCSWPARAPVAMNRRVRPMNSNTTTAAGHTCNLRSGPRGARTRQEGIKCASRRQSLPTLNHLRQFPLLPSYIKNPLCGLTISVQGNREQTPAIHNSRSCGDNRRKSSESSASEELPLGLCRIDLLWSRIAPRDARFGATNSLPCHLTAH